MNENQANALKELNIDLQSFGNVVFDSCNEGFEINYDGLKTTIKYSKESEFFRAINILKTQDFSNSFCIKQKSSFKTLSVMLDNSRNAVMKVETAKLWIRNLALMGYNQLQIYTEDTIEVDDNPLFGYGRGKFTQNEIKEIVNYGEMFGIEVVPAIQTLAHFTSLKRWNHYQNFMDINDILLVDDQNTYDLIEKILISIRKCYKTNKINIGMDEAHLLGRGKFIDKNGYEPRFDILCRHLSKVLDLLKKYNFEPMMWSDMFFRASICADYFYNTKKDFPLELKKKVPNDVNLIYWDYYGTDKAKYDNMIRTHKQLNNKTIFAGGVWTWMGFAPLNKYSIECTKVALSSCVEGGIDEIIMTLWGDDSAECPLISGLATLCYAAEFAYGSVELVEKNFKSITRVEFNDWLKLDLPNQISLPKELWNSNCSKYYLFNDYFIGLLNNSVKLECVDLYKTFVKELNPLAKQNSEYSDLFALMKKLCEVLQIKSTLGIRTKEAYKSKDKKNLKVILRDYKKVELLLVEFYKSLRNVWFKYNKGNGFEIQATRIGGLITRTKDCEIRLNDFIKGKINKIEELEEESIYYQGNKTKEEYLMSFGKIYSPSDITFMY